MTNTSVSSQSRVFIAWSIFIVTVFESIDLTLLPGELQAFLPKDFKDAGFGDTSMLENPEVLFLERLLGRDTHSSASTLEGEIISLRFDSF